MEHPTCYKDNPKNKQNSKLPMSNKSVNLMQNQSWNLKAKHAQYRATKPCQTGTKQELIPTYTRMQSPLRSTGTGWQLQITKFKLNSELQNFKPQWKSHQDHTQKSETTRIWNYKIHEHLFFLFLFFSSFFLVLTKNTKKTDSPLPADCTLYQ